MGRKGGRAKSAKKANHARANGQKGGRPVTVAIEEGQVALKMGEPRRGATPVSPEKMLRKAAAEAEIREKNRPKNTRDRR